MESNVDYFSRRASEERAAADAAQDARAREAHLELARRYIEAADGSPVELPANDGPISPVDVPFQNITYIR